MFRLQCLRFTLRNYERNPSRSFQAFHAIRRLSVAADTPSSSSLEGDSPAFRSVLQPKSPNEPSMFEEHSVEYLQHRPLSTPVEFDKDHWNQTFLDLVTEKEYGKAVELREQLVTLGIDVDLDPTYETIEEDVDLLDKMSSFLRIWDLVPDFRYAIRVAPETLHRFDNLLAALQKFAMDITSMMAFGKLCASKGYGPYVGSLLISHIVRFASPSLSSAFVMDFDEITSRLYAHTPWFRHKRAYWYNISIRGQLRGARWDAAVDEVLTARLDREARIDRLTYKMLLTTLREAQRPDLLAKVAAWARRDIPTIGLDRPRIQPRDDLHETILRFEDDQEAADALARAIRYQKHSTKHITDFIDLCIGMGRSGIPERVNEIARSHQMVPLINAPSWVGRWAEATMLHAWRGSAPRQTLARYEEFFQVQGTPLKDLMPIDRDRPIKRSGDSQRRKPWPTHNGQAMALQAIISLTDSWDGLENLYSRVLTVFFESSSDEFTAEGDQPGEPETNDDDMSYQIPPRLRPNEHVFTQFLTAFRLAAYREKTRLRIRDKALEMVRDMHLYGVETKTPVFWTMLVGILARHPDLKGVMAILRRMEGVEETNTPWSDVVVPEGMQLPKPDIVVYTTAITRLLEAKHLFGAARVREMARLTDATQDSRAIFALGRVRRWKWLEKKHATRVMKGGPVPGTLKRQPELSWIDFLENDGAGDETT